MKLPQLKKDFLTIAQLSERWSELTGEEVTQDRVIAHGQDGSLEFTVGYGLCDLTDTWRDIDFSLETDAGYIPFAKFPINKEQFSWLVCVTYPLLRIWEFLGGIEGFINTDAYASRFTYVSKDSLIIAMEEIVRFETSQGIDEKPAYLDTNSPYYAKELAIAIEAHTAIFINGEGSKHKAVGERVKTWVSEHYPNESKSGAFVDRISSVVLPKKNNLTL